MKFGWWYLENLPDLCNEFKMKSLADWNPAIPFKVSFNIVVTSIESCYTSKVKNVYALWKPQPIKSMFSHKPI